MSHIQDISIHNHLIKKCLLAFAACGLMFPGASVAQSSLDSEAVLEDGTYLFGQSQDRDQLGMTYAILSVQDNQTVGAFYQPRSSFDCFSGQISPTELAVNIVDSYEQTVYPYEVAVTLDNTLVAGNGAGTYVLDGFHRIDEISAKDREMLSVCQSDLAN